MKTRENSYPYIVNEVINGDLKRQEKVTILLLISNDLELFTISEMARRENKTPLGIRNSKRYNKIKIGNQLMTYKKHYK